MTPETTSDTLWRISAGTPAKILSKVKKKNEYSDTYIDYSRVSSQISVSNNFKYSCHNFTIDASTDFLGFPQELSFSYCNIASKIFLRIPLEIIRKIPATISSEST